MIPYPVDSVLVREHMFQDTGNMEVVLDSFTFDRFGGHKPLRDFGLGYLNYQLRADNEVYSRSLSDLLRTDMYDHFTKYFVCYLITLSAWLLFFTLDYQYILNLMQTLPLLNKLVPNHFSLKKSTQEDLEYHYIKA